MSRKTLQFLKAFLGIAFLIFLPAFDLFSDPAEPSKEPPVNFLFRDSYYVSPTLKLKYDIYEVEGLLLVRESKRFWHSEFSIATSFHGPMLESRVLKNIHTIDEARAFLEKKRSENLL